MEQTLSKTKDNVQQPNNTFQRTMKTKGACNKKRTNEKQINLRLREGESGNWKWVGYPVHSLKIFVFVCVGFLCCFKGFCWLFGMSLWLLWFCCQGVLRFSVVLSCFI